MFYPCFGTLFMYFLELTYWQDVTVPVLVFCCFWFQKSYTGNILGIGRDKKPEIITLPWHDRSPRGRRSWAPGPPHLPQARPRAGPRLGMVRPTWAATDLASSPICSATRENPKYPSKNPQKAPTPPSSSTLVREGSEALPGTLPKREITPEAFFITMPAFEAMRE